MKNTHKPIRMCVVCKARVYQKELMRLANIDGKIVKNPKNTRSFYLCQTCLKKDEKILTKALVRFSKGAQIKEIFNV